MTHPIRVSPAAVPHAQMVSPPCKISVLATAIFASLAATLLLPWHLALPINACLFGIALLTCCEDEPKPQILVEQPAFPGVNLPPPVWIEPPPLVVAPQPVFIEPAPIVMAPPPVYVQERPMYPLPRPVHVPRPHNPYAPRAPVGTGAFTPPHRAAAPARPAYSPAAPRAPVGTGAFTPPHRAAAPARPAYSPAAPRAPVGTGAFTPPQRSPSPMTPMHPHNPTAARAPVGRR